MAVLRGSVTQCRRLRPKHKSEVELGLPLKFEPRINSDAV